MLYLTFTLEDSEFGIRVDDVVEIRTLGKITSLVSQPDWMVGIFEHRGDIVRIIDLKKKYGIPESDKTDLIIVFDFGEISHSILVDSVNDVIDVDTDKTHSVEHRFAEKLYVHQDRTISLLNAFYGNIIS